MLYMREVAELLLKTHAVTLRVNPPYKWVSGILAPIYTDNRILISYPSERERVIGFLMNALKSNGVEFDTIAGVSTSGIPWAAWLAERLNKPMIYVRSSGKDHGKENLIEGKLEKGAKVIVVEDLISTGNSALGVVEAIRNAECSVECCLVIFTYELQNAKDNFNKIGCKLIPLTKFSTLIELATDQGYITDDEKKMAIDWSKNPEAWGK